MNTVSHHGRTTAYWQAGETTSDQPSVLCIHGSGGSHTIWHQQFTLADDLPIAALDLSGHGASDDIEADPGYETLSAYADDVVAVADATNATVLVGASLGGAIALWVALQRELHLNGLVLVGTGAKLSVLDDLLVWLTQDFDRALDFLHEPDRLFHDPDEPTHTDSRERMEETGRAVTERDFLTCHTFDVRERLGDVSVPTLAVVGEHDKLTPPWFHTYLADEIPGCSLVRIDGAAHLVMLEQPSAFNDVLTSFLDRTRHD